MNFKGKYENLECELCKKEEESQEHIIMRCNKLVKGEIVQEYEEEKKYKEVFKIS